MPPGRRGAGMRALLGLALAACARDGALSFPGLDGAGAPPPDLTATADPPRDLALPDAAPADLASVDQGPCRGPPLSPKLPSLVMPNRLWFTTIALAAGDLDGDGHVDLVAGTVLHQPPGIVVAYGRGDGTFGDAQALSTSDASDVALADLDGDGRLDVAYADMGGLEVARNLGQRRFSPPPEHDGLGPTTSLAVGDLDQDGALDLLVGHSERGAVDLHRGLGGGTFAPPLLFADHLDPATLALADLDRDGDLDLLAGSAQATGATLLFGDGKGGWLQRAEVAAPVQDGAIADGRVVDLDGDGWLDLALPLRSAGAIYWSRNRGRRDFAAPQAIPFDGAPYSTSSLAVLDLDGDGRPDLIPVMWDGGPLEVLFNQGGGRFAAPVRIASFGDCGQPRRLAVADFNEDHQPDLACASFDDNLLPVLLGSCR